MEDIVLIPVTSLEQRIIVNALNKLKEYQIKHDKDYTVIDDITIKVCDAKPPREKGHRRKHFEER